MDITTIIGLVFVSVAIIGSILTGADLILFVDIPSVICVGGGLIGATCIKWPIEVIKTVATVMMKTIFITPVDPKKTIDEIVKLAETARRESVFALEKVQIDDIFLKKAMNLAADNRPPEVLQSILQLEIDSMEERH